MNYFVITAAIVIGILGASAIRRDRLARGGRDGLWSWRDGADDRDI